MSRFVEILHENKNMINMKNFPGYFEIIEEQIGRRVGTYGYSVPLFYQKRSSGIKNPELHGISVRYLGHYGYQ